MGKKEILEKLSKGEISVEEAMKMEAEDQAFVSEVPAYVKNKKYKFLVIKVTQNNQKKVHVRLPLALAKLAKSQKFKFGGDDSNFNSKIFEELDIDEIIRIAEEEGTTKFVDVQSDDGENVEIYIE